MEDTATVAVHIPQTLYRRLEQWAEEIHQPLDDLITQTLDTVAPTSSHNLPPDVQDELASLALLSDDELWQVARSVVDTETHTQMSQLLDKNQAGTITETERGILDQLCEVADRVMLRKAQAYVLLKERGYQLPSLKALGSS